MCNGNIDVQGATILRAYCRHVHMSQGCVHIHMMICYTNFDILDYKLDMYHVIPEIHHFKTSVSCAPSTCWICGVRGKEKNESSWGDGFFIKFLVGLKAVFEMRKPILTGHRCEFLFVKVSWFVSKAGHKGSNMHIGRNDCIAANLPTCPSI